MWQLEPNMSGIKINSYPVDKYPYLQFQKSNPKCLGTTPPLSGIVGGSSGGDYKFTSTIPFRLDSNQFPKKLYFPDSN